MRECGQFRKMPEDRFSRSALLVRVIDGDTFDVEIDLGWSMKLKERIRLEQVDTPEIRKREEQQAGKWVRDRVARLFREGTRLIITSMAYDRSGNVRGKYGRTMAVVYRAKDGLCLNQYLIQKRLCWLTDEKGSLLEERSLTSLTGIPAKHRKKPRLHQSQL
jgi:micrococcal nuclease